MTTFGLRMSLALTALVGIIKMANCIGHGLTNQPVKGNQTILATDRHLTLSQVNEQNGTTATSLATAEDRLPMEMIPNRSADLLTLPLTNFTDDTNTNHENISWNSGSGSMDGNQSQNAFDTETSTGSLMPEDYDTIIDTPYNDEYNISSADNQVILLIIKRFQMIGYVVVPTFLLVGLFGNTMTVIVMRHSLFRATSIAIILVALSLSDSALLLMVPFNKLFVQKYLGFDVRALHWFGCKAFFWFWRTAKMTSSWFIVLISLERFVVINYPLKARTLVTKRTAVCGILLVYTVIGTFNLIWVSFSDVIRGGKCLSNVADDPAKTAFVRAFVVAGSSLYTHIPVVLTVFFNLISVIKLIRQDRKRRLMTQMMRVTHPKRQDTSSLLSAMLIGISFAFFVLVTPISVLHALTVYKGVNLFHTTDYVLVIVREVAMTTEQLNYSINFYLYVLCSSAFRKQFVSIIKKRICCHDGRPRIAITIADGGNKINKESAKTATPDEDKEDKSRCDKNATKLSETQNKSVRVEVEKLET
ncbi:hypothetical protein LSH36_1201g00044 [Paralvinella palmiformis]|uniref:G-protein coupled receptors family 1 profile domain-containing protein n=1 Tax=Paralvinella palmiformis TaxID=53620 RepID=A0AAD9MP64_9ANNE|nr:hypothetical protein LSH36_1201g00044 [Paralvinella palmiformis]